MDNNIKAWLYNILNAIMEIKSFLNYNTKEFAKYQHDLRTKRAVERNVEIIGEALKRILKRKEIITRRCWSFSTNNRSREQVQ